MSNSPRMNECLHACKHSSKLPWRHPQMLKRAPRLESIDRSSPIGTPPSAIGSKRASIACKSINRSSLLAPWIRPSSGIGRDESVNKRTRGHRHGEGGERREGEEAMESTVGGLGGEDGGGREGGKGVGGLKQTLTLKGTGVFTCVECRNSARPPKYFEHLIVNIICTDMMTGVKIICPQRPDSARNYIKFRTEE